MLKVDQVVKPSEQSFCLCLSFDDLASFSLASFNKLQVCLLKIPDYTLFSDDDVGRSTLLF